MLASPVKMSHRLPLVRPTRRWLPRGRSPWSCNRDLLAEPLDTNFLSFGLRATTYKRSAPTRKVLHSRHTEVRVIVFVLHVLTVLFLATPTGTDSGDIVPSFRAIQHSNFRPTKVCRSVAFHSNHPCRCSTNGLFRRYVCRFTRTLYMTSYI